jgi:hypothetical protein
VKLSAKAHIASSPEHGGNIFAAVFGSGHAAATERSEGANNISSSIDFSHWRIGNFGNGAQLSAEASLAVFSMSSVFGAGFATGDYNKCAVDFSNWSIGNFGENVVALSVARDYSSVFGTGWATDNDIDFSNWTIGNIGAGTLFYSSSFCSTVFGSARLNEAAQVNNWTIGNMGDGVALITMSSNDGIDSGAPDYYTYPSCGSVFGSAFNEGTATNPSNWTVEFQGSALLASIGYNSEGPENIRLGTLGGDSNHDFRFYFNGNQASNPTVNIAALVLGSAVEDPVATGGKAVLVLANDQGGDYVIGDRAVVLDDDREGDDNVRDRQNQVDPEGGRSTYAQAVALGPNFQLNIGRSRIMADTRETDESIGSGGQASGGPGTVNIFGAISRAKCHNTTDTHVPGSIMRIHNGWTVNSYGPVEDLSAIDVDNGNFSYGNKPTSSSFNTYANLKNVTFVNGTTNAYGVSDGIGIITLNGGNLRISQRNDSGFATALADLQSKMVYVDPITKEVYKGSEGNVSIEGSDYPWKGPNTNPNFQSTGGKLILHEGDLLVFHVDSSKRDSSVETGMGNGADEAFDFVNGYVWIDGEALEGVQFNNGQLAIINDDQDNPGILPAHSDFWLIRSSQKTNVLPLLGLLNLEDDFELQAGSDLREAYLRGAEDGGENGEISDTYLGRMVLIAKNREDYASLGINPYSQWDSALNVYAFQDEYGSGMFVGTGATPRHAIPTDFARRHANGELAGISIGLTSLLRNSVENRLTDAKGNGNDPFVSIVYGDFHQDDIDGFGYDSDFVGIAGGLDYVYKFANGDRYLRMGMALGYFDGKTKFFGTASGLGKKVDHDVYEGAIFAAYESFGKNNLKTDINLFVGLGYEKNKLARIDANMHEFEGKMSSNNQFVKLEAVKNLLSFNGVQTGPWLFVNYNHVIQNGYTESRVQEKIGSQTVSKIKHDYLDITLGVNMEKEFQSTVDPDSMLRLFLKAGWCHRALRKHSSATVYFDVPGLGDSYSPILGYPAKNSAIFVAGFRRKFNANWELTASWHGTFSKNIRHNILSASLGYDF